MLIIVLALAASNIIFGICAWNAYGWQVGLPVIIASFIIMWLAVGASAGYESAEKLKKIKNDTLNSELLENQEKMINALCKKLNISQEELEMLMEQEEIEKYKNIEIKDMPVGFKVVLLKELTVEEVGTFKVGTVGKIKKINGNNNWTIEFTLNKKHYDAGCGEGYFMNYYKYLEEHKNNNEEVKKED